MAPLGFGLVATHAVSSAVARSFDVGQGRAVGIATSGSTAGQFVFMPILGLVLAGGGWRLGYQALAGACLVVAIVAWWLLRNAGAATAARGPATGTEEGFVTRVGYLLRRPAFHGLFWSYLLCGYTSTGVVETHLIPFAQFCGIPPAPSALAFGILMGVNTLGMIAAGYLTDRMNRTVLLASIYFFRSLTFLMLPLLIDETAVLWVFAFLFGVFDYATVPPRARCGWAPASATATPFRSRWRPRTAPFAAPPRTWWWCSTAAPGRASPSAPARRLFLVQVQA